MDSILKRAVLLVSVTFDRIMTAFPMVVHAK